MKFDEKQYGKVTIRRIQPNLLLPANDLNGYYGKRLKFDEFDYENLPVAGSRGIAALMTDKKVILSYQQKKETF